MTAPTNTPSAPPRAGGGNKLQAWLRTHKGQAAAGAGAVGAVGLALYRRHNAQSSPAAASSVPADATSAGGIPGSYAPVGDGGGGFYGGDSGTPSGTDAVGLLNGVANLIGSLPIYNGGVPADGGTSSSGGGTFNGGPAVGGAYTPPTAKPTKKKPVKVTTVRKTKINPPGRHNTTVKTVKTTKIVRPAPSPRPGHHHHR